MTSEFVTLKSGLTVPREAAEVAIDLERRGFQQTVNGNGHYEIQPALGLSESDRARIARWKAHLALLVMQAEPEAK